MSGFTVDMALEEIRFARAHAHDFARIAILTRDQWIAWSAWLSQMFGTPTFVSSTTPKMPKHGWAASRPVS
jgi:hypothetical protein